MDYKRYEHKLNDVIKKCPIEAGIEILVYNVLDEIIDFTKMSLVDINRLRKGRDERLTTGGGVADIAVLPIDFEYQNRNTGDAYGFIEVKAVNKELLETEQILGQKAKSPHYIYTNGLVWKYYFNKIERWEIPLATVDNKECKWINDSRKVSIDCEKFSLLINELKSITWKNNAKTNR